MVVAETMLPAATGFRRGSTSQFASAVRSPVGLATGRPGLASAMMKVSTPSEFVLYQVSPATSARRTEGAAAPGSRGPV